MESIPSDRGSYILISSLSHKCCIPTGALGDRLFPSGLYFYCGSALGPGGLRSRIAHHLQPSPNPRWHMDYLKSFVEMLHVWFLITDQSFECRFVDSLIKLPDASQPVRHFGSRDCRSGCTSHLVHFPADMNKCFELLKMDFESLKRLDIA